MNNNNNLLSTEAVEEKTSLSNITPQQEDSSSSANRTRSSLFYVPASISDILLAHSKDIRYHISLSRLILSCILPYLMTRCSSTQTTADGWKSSQQGRIAWAILPEIQFISNAIHSLFTIMIGRKRKQQTLGMEALHLYPLQMTRQGTLMNPKNLLLNSSTTSQQQESLSKSHVSSLGSWYTSSSSSFSFFYFIYTTIIPYLLHRASTKRRGWTDIQQVLQLSSFWKTTNQQGQESHHDQKDADSNVDNNSTLINNMSSSSQLQSQQNKVERLRGEDRKQVFYQMRHQMMTHRGDTQQATIGERQSSVTTTSTTTSTIPTIRNHHSTTLQQSNHRYHDDENEIHPENNNKSSSFMSPSRWTNKYSYLNQVCAYPWKGLQCIASVLEELSTSTSNTSLQRYFNPLSTWFPMDMDILDGYFHNNHNNNPSTVIDENQVNTTTTNNNTTNNGNTEEQPSKNHRSFTNTFITSLLQIHLALFYIHGKYPTLLHRIMKTQVFQERNISSSSRKKVSNSEGSIKKKTTTVHPPDDDTLISEQYQQEQHQPSSSSYRLIGYLIFLEGSMKLIQAIIKKAVDYSFDGNKKMGSTWVMSMESKIPCFYSQPKSDDIRTNDVGIVTTHPSLTCSPSTATQCSICFHDRTHPACPKACGHVFCWSCIQRWLITVRMECPFCRTPTRPQDIVPLYHYEP